MARKKKDNLVVMELTPEQTAINKLQTELQCTQRELQQSQQDFDEVFDLWRRASDNLRTREDVIHKQRVQLQMFSEKLELMKTWGGIFRTIKQRLKLEKPRPHGEQN